MSNLIEIRNLYKIFGNNEKEVFHLVKKGMGKDELLEKTNSVLGLNNINLNYAVNLVLKINSGYIKIGDKRLLYYFSEFSS